MYPQDPDPHEAALARQRAEVQAAFAPRERTCPHCGHVQTAPGRTCERCGGDFVVRRGRVRRRRVAFVTALVLAAAAALTAAVVPGMVDDARDQERTAAERQARLEAAERKRLLVQQRPVRAEGPQRRRGEAPLAHRARLVAAAEAAITTDARRRVREGTLDGPVQGTICSPYPKTGGRQELEADATVPAGRYQCIAYERKVELTELDGKPRTGVYGSTYWLVADYRNGALTFCKISLLPGEGGKPLARVRVPPACGDPLD